MKRAEALSQNGLAILDTAGNDVLKLPAGRLVDALETVRLAPLLLRLGRDTLGEGLGATSNTSGKSNLELVGDLVTSLEQSVEILLVVSRRDTEASAGADERRGGVADNNDRDFALKHRVAECGHLSRVVKHDGDNGGVVVAVDDEAKTLKTQAEVARVESNTLQTLGTLTRAKLASDETQGSQNLHENRGGGRLAVDSSGVGAPQLVDNGLLSSDVSTVGTERLGEGTHENVNTIRVNTEVVANTTSAGTDGTNGVSLVDEEIELVLVLQRHDTGQIAHGSLHGVETLNGNQNLLPRAVSAGLSLRDGLAELALEIDHVVVLEGRDDGTGQTSTDSDGGVVELIRENQATLGDESREGRGVGDKTHGEDHRSGLSDETGDFLLDLESQVGCTHIGARAASAESVLLDALLDGIGTGTFGLGKAKVVVRAHVEGLSVGSGVVVSSVVVTGLAVHEGDVAAGNTGDGSGKAVVNAHLESADVEVVKVLVQGRIAVLRLESLVVLLVAEPLAEEVASMAEENEEQVADVGGEDVVVRRLINDGRVERLSIVGLAHVAVARVQEGTELSIVAALLLRLEGGGRRKEGRRGLAVVGLVGVGGRERDGRQGDGGGSDLGGRNILLLHGQESLLGSLVVLILGALW